MTERILRSNRKVFPNEPVVSVKKSRKIILLSSSDLSSTPKESENDDEAPKKKAKRKKIRRTQNSFHIEDECEATLKERCAEPSNTKTIRKVERRNNPSFIFDISSENDSVFQDLELSPTKTLKRKKNLRLPPIELDDFQQSKQCISEVGQEFCSIKGNMPKDISGVDKNMKKNFKHVKEPPTQVFSHAKKTLKSNTSIRNSERIKSVDNSNEEEENKENFSTSPMIETKQILNSRKLSNCHNNSSVAIEPHKDVSSYPGILNNFANECSTSDESDFKNGQEKFKAMKKQIRHSSSKENATYSSEMKARFSNDRQETLISENVQPFALKSNGDVQCISQQIDSSSDSEIEFNCCVKDPLQTVSDFSLTRSNAKISNNREDCLDSNRKNILVETKFESNTDNNRPNLSMSVATINCGVEIPEMNLLSKENNNGLHSNLDKRGRKRWTILEGPAARRSFQVQIENLRKSLLMPNKEQCTPEDSEFFKPRRSLRKRWSGELRKSISALDVSKNSKCDFYEKDSGTDETVVNQEETNRFSIKSRRSRSLTNNSNDTSIRQSPKTTPLVRNTKLDASINDSSSPSRNPSKIINFENQSDDDFLNSTAVKQSSHIRRSSSMSETVDIPQIKKASKCYKTTPHVEKSKSDLTIEGASSDSKIKIQDDSFEMGYVDDIGVVRKSSVRWSSSVPENLDSPMRKKNSKCYKTTPHIRKSKPDLTIDDAKSDSEVQIQEDTFEMEYVDDIGLVRKSSVRRSRSLSDNSNEISTQESPKSIPHVRNTKPDVSMNGLSNPSRNSSYIGNLEKQKGVNDISFLKSNDVKQSSNIRLSSSVPETLNSPQIKKEFKSYKATPQVRKSKLDLTIDEAINDSEIQFGDDTFEMEYVDDIGLVRKSSVRRSSSVPETLNSPQIKKTFKSYKTTPHVRKSKPDLTIDEAISDSEVQIQDDTFEMEYVDDIGSVRKSSVRLSRSSSDNSNDNSTHESPNTTLHAINVALDVSINNLSNPPQHSSKIIISENQNDVTDVEQSSNVPGSSSVPDILDTSQIKKSFKSHKTTPLVRKSKPDLTIDEDASDSAIQIEGDTFEMEYVDDIGLIRKSSLRRSRSLSDALSNTSTHKSPKTTTPAQEHRLGMAAKNSSNRSRNSSKRRTFEIQKNANDTGLLRSSAIKPSSDVRRSSSVVNNLDSLSMKKTSRSFRATPHVRKSKPDISIHSATNDTKLKKENTFVMENLNGSGSPSTSTVGARLKRRDTYELNESVTNLNLLKSLSDSTITEIGVGVLPNDNSQSFNASKKVRFENVTMRKILKRFDKESEVADDQNTLKNKVNAVSKKVSFKKSLDTNRSMSLDQTFSPFPFMSSTPNGSSRKPNSQKSSNNGMKNASHGRRRSKSADEGNFRITRIRMPNFAKIHEKARDRMENIVQLTERKAERAKLLLSGQKPSDSQVILNENNGESIKQSHKQLHFDMSQPSTSKGFLRVVHQGSTKKDQFNKELIIPNKNNQLAASSKIPICNEGKPETKSGFLRVAVPDKGRSTRKILPQKTIGHNKITHFGFKIKSDTGTENKAEQIKAVVTKSKLQQDNRAEQRTILKGVRGNRRFELLMKMRKNE